MKKTLSIAFVLMFTIGLTACGGPSTGNMKDFMDEAKNQDITYKNCLVAADAKADAIKCYEDYYKKMELEEDMNIEKDIRDWSENDKNRLIKRIDEDIATMERSMNNLNK